MVTMFKSCKKTASEKGYADIVKLLLENGANFNLIDSVGQSALDLGKYIK